MATQAQINAIAGLYVAYFDRAPDPAGLQFWIDQIDNGRDFGTISQDFANSAEAQAIYPFLSDDNDLGEISPVAFITNIYVNLFGRVPDQPGLDFWTGLLESGTILPGDMVETISLSAEDNLNGNGFFDRTVMDNKIECALYFTEQASEIATFPAGDQPGQFEIGSPEYLAAVGAIGAANDSDASVDECQNFIDTILREFIPNSSFTLCEVKVAVPGEAETELKTVTKKVLYWGDPDGEDGDNGIPADAFFGEGGYFQTIALQDFAELDVIDTDMDQFSIIDWSSVTNVTLTANSDLSQNSNDDSDSNDFFEDEIVEDDNNGTIAFGSLVVTYPDGSTDDIALGEEYFFLLYDLMFDSNNESRFYEADVAVGLPVYLTAGGEFTTVPQPGQEPVGTIDGQIRVETGEVGETTYITGGAIVLTPTENNGGTKEAGFTSDDNDFIQVGEVTLLHGAIIDGGGGYNTLEIDAKGHFAQPKALNNIQQVTVENLPNVYTIGQDNASQYPDVVEILEVIADAIEAATPEGGSPDDVNLLELLEGIDLTDLGGLEGLVVLLQAFLGLPDTDSVIDLSRATDLENLTVTEGSYQWLDSAITSYPFLTNLLGALNGNVGGLNLVGMRNDATLTLQGDFSLPLFVQTGAGFTGDGFTVILENVNSDVGNGGMYIFQNAPKLNLVSEGGGNYIRNLNENEPGINGHVTDLEISGSAHLFIESNLINIFENDTPAHIDASQNTGGVDLNISGLEHVTFVGSQGNDRFSAATRDDDDTSVADDYIPDSEITITNLVGDNYYDVEAKKLTLTDGDGNIELEADTAGAFVTLGNGDNIVAMDTAQLDLTVGNGDNIIDVEMEDVFNDSGDGQGQVLENKNQFEKRVDIVAGDGANKICIEIEGDDDSNIGSDTFDYLQDNAVVNITAGNGGNIIEVIQDSNDFTLSDVNINTGDGNDTIRVEADDISINSGGGNDTIVLVGTDSDFVFDEADLESGSGDAALEAGDINPFEFHNGALLNIDTGTGSADIHLGAGEDDFGLPSKNIIAKDGSVITGEDITLHVDTFANLIAAELSGVTGVVLDDDARFRQVSSEANDQYFGDRAQLTLTAEQFLEIGAENFSVDGATFNTHAFIKLIISEDTNLSDLGLDDLQGNIDLYIEINDGAEVTMTAEQLHTKIARDGVTIAEDGNTDYGMGSVVVTGGGLDFDPFNTNDMVKSVIGGNTYFGGSLSQDFMVDGAWFNVQVKSVFGGYDRPADVAAEVFVTVDADITPEVGAFDTWHDNLEIVGNQDITFTGPIELGLLQGENDQLFTVDFSSLEGVAHGLTLGNFEMVEAVHGNSTIGYETEVFVEIAGDSQDDDNDSTSGDNTDPEDVGFDNDEATEDNDDRALISQGVQQYTVTVIEGNGVMTPEQGDIATIRLCDDTEDLEVIALRGNWNDTLRIEDAGWGLDFELQAGGTLKREGPTKFANVGSLEANFKWYCAETTVDIFHSVDGDTRTIATGDIVLNNVETANINVTGNAIIESISGENSNGPDDASALATINIDGSGAVEVVEKIDVTDGNTNLIDAADVVGTITVGVDGGTVDDNETPDNEDDDTITPGGDFTFIGAQGGSTLTLCNVDDDEAEGVTIDGGSAGVALIIEGAVDLDESTLTNVTSVTLTDNSSLRIDLDDVDAIGAENFDYEPGDGTAASLMLVGLNDQEFSLASFDPDITPIMVALADDPIITLHPNTDLSGITMLEVDEGQILNLSALQFQQLTGNGMIVGTDSTTDFTVNITDWDQAATDFDDPDDSADGAFIIDGITADTITLTMAGDIVLGTDDSLGPVTSSTESVEVIMPDGTTITAPSLEDINGVDFTGGANTTIDVTDITFAGPGGQPGIDAGGFDVDLIRLPNVLVADRNVDALLDGLPERVVKEIYTGLGFVDGVTQTVILEEGTTVPGNIGFIPLDAGTELAIFNLIMEGGTEIGGHLILSQSDSELSDVPGAPILQLDLQEVNITSTGTVGNVLTGETANVIDGDLTPLAIVGAPALYDDNDMLTVNISGDQDFVLTGSIVFNSTVANDVVVVNDDDAATATLNVNNSGSTTIGDLDTDSPNVDFLVVNNEGTGDLTVGISSLSTVDAGDVITLNGSATGLDTAVVTGTRDFSGDTIEADWDIIQFNNKDNGLTTTASTVTAASGDVFITVTQAQFNAIGVAGFQANGDDSNITGDNDAVLNLVNFDGAIPFDATGLDGDIIIGTITMAPGVQTLDPTTNLTGVGKIDVPEGGTLNLTAAQYQQLVGIGGLKICVVDGADADATIDAPITVNITDLTQADIENGPFDLSMILTDDTNDDGNVGNVTVSLAENVELSDDDIVQTADGADAGTVLESNVEFILADGQDLGIDNWDQADGLEITGTGTTDVFFRFDNMNGTTHALTDRVDVSGYSVSQLHALNTFLGGYNIEDTLQDLAGSVELVIYNNPADLGILNTTNRVVIVEPGVTVQDQTALVDAAIMITDVDADDEVLSITIYGMGGTNIDGNVIFPSLSGTSAPKMHLQSFTFISEGDGVTENLLSGGTANVISGDISPFGFNATFVENNLLLANLEANQELNITGTIFFNGVEGEEDDSASLNVSGTAPVTIAQLDVESAEGTAGEIQTFAVNNTGTSTLAITGASNSIQLSGSVETLTFSGTGNIELDTADNGTGSGNNGLNGSGLETLDASGLIGNLSLGVVENVDNDDFSFTAGSGVTTMTMAYDMLSDDGDGWSFDFTAAAPGSQLTLGLDPDSTAGDLMFEAGSDLNINMGPNGVLCINQDENFSAVNLSITSTQPIVVKDGVTLTLTAAQASGLTFVGENGAASTGIVNIVELGSDPVDLSGISADLKGQVLLGSNDVTLDANTDLGIMELALVAQDNGDFSLAGQTIRFSTEEQASGQDIDVYASAVANGDGSVTTTAVVDTSGNALTNSTNVVFLFDEIDAPLSTSGFYDPLIGRVWFSAALLNDEGGDVENLFDSLPSTILRVDFNTVEEIDFLFASSQIDRIIELTSFTDLDGITELDDGFPPEEHIETLRIFAGGEVTVGDVVVGDLLLDPSFDPDSPEFTKLTFNSLAALHEDHILATEDFVNNNDGTADQGESVFPINLNLFGDVMVGAGSDPIIDLLDVQINTGGDYDTALGMGLPANYIRLFGADFQAGTIFYDSEDAGSTGLLTLTGENDVTLKAIDTSDSDVVTVTVDQSSHSGSFILTGGSPGFIGGDDTGDGNTETLNIRNGSDTDGQALFGHIFDEGVDDFVINIDVDTGLPFAGVDASTLSTINTHMHGGNVHLGFVTDIDAEEGFTLNNAGSAGDVTMILGTAVTAGGPETPDLNDGTWTFDNTGSAGVMNIILDDVTVTGGSMVFNNADVNVSGDVDLTALDSITFGAGTTLNVDAGATLCLTVQQVIDMPFAITGSGTVKVIGNADDVAGAEFEVLKTVNVDLGAVVLTDADGTLATAGDEVLEASFTGATDDAGDPAGQNVIGSNNDDTIDVASALMDTITGGLGDDTLDGFEGNDTYNVDAGTDTVPFLGEDAGVDTLVVSGGAAVEANVASGVGTGNFIATADTVNDGMATISVGAGDPDGDGLIDVSLAGGDNGFILVGAPETGTEEDELIGSDQNDIFIDALPDGPINAGEVDTFTGNGGADIFVFSHLLSTPDAPTVTPQVVAVDQETLTVTADGFDDDNEEIIINYSVNGIGASLTVDNTPPLDVTNATAVATAIAAALNGVANVTATSSGDTVTAQGDDGASFEVLSVSYAGTRTGLTVTPAEGTDATQDTDVTIPTTVVEGEVYTLSVVTAEGTNISVSYQATDTSGTTVATNLVALFEAQAPAVTVTASNVGGTSNVITLLDENADDGGFTVTTSVTPAVTATGASTFGATTLAEADVITDFLTEVDQIDLNAVAGDGDGTNYFEAAEKADYGTALTDAEAAINGSVAYYLTSTAADGGLLFFDADGNGDVDGVVRLTGVTEDNFEAGDIIG